MEEVICRRRVVSVTCGPDAQHFTRLVEAVTKSPDHASKGSPTTSTPRVSQIVLYNQGATLDVPTKTAP